MNQTCDLEVVNIDDLVKTSKQVQNRVRQNIQALNYCHDKFRDQEDLPPIWDGFTLDPYVKKVVADYMNSSPRTQETSRPVFTSRTRPEMSTKRRDAQVKQPQRFPSSQEKKNLGHRESYSTELLQTPENMIRQCGPTSIVSVNKSVRRQRCAKTNTKETPAKQPKKRELPLQRFAGLSSEIIDFSKEHPNLELCTSQSTVFPRRCHKSLGEHSSQRNLSIRDSVNLAAAKMREPKITAPKIREPKITTPKMREPRITTPEIAIPILLKVLEQNEKFHAQSIQKEAALPAEKKTWKELFKNNKSNEKTATGATKASPKMSAVVDNKRGIDVICTPYKGLYHLEKEGALLSRQKMCSLQRLPVMYIRPECRVQRVANISIHGNNSVDQEQRTHETVLSNVGYIECRHEHGANKAVHGINKVGEDSLHEQVSSPTKSTVPTIRPGVPPVKSSNNFIDALGSTELRSRKSFSSVQSDSISVTSSVVDMATGASAMEEVESNTRDKVKEISKRPMQRNKNQHPTRDVCVQTDCTKTLSESPPGNSTPSMSSQIPSLILSEEGNTDGSLLSAQCEFDDQTSSSVGTTEQSQTRLNETFSVGKASDVSNDFEKLNPDSSEAGPSERERSVRQRRKKKPLPRVELFLHDNTCEGSDRCEYAQSTKASMSLPGEASGAPANHSMETEVKRAVKIFLKSLMPENGDFYIGHERCASNLPYKLKFSRPPRKTDRAGVLREYDSFSSSGKENEEGLDGFDELSSFSMSSSSSEVVDSTRPGKSSAHSQNNRSDSLSEGEVLSVGEV